jgi:iron-sulfur cluster insertion protein
VSKEELINFTDDFTMNLDTGQLIIDNLSLMYLTGTVVDYKKDIFGQRLMIENPNVASMCGCGESFSVKDND